MPNRWISGKICDSPNFNKLSSGAVDLFIRCLTQADDLGCFQSTPAYIKGHCYPLKDISLRDIELYELEIESNNVVLSWDDSGRKYSVFITFPEYNHPQRRHARKTPAPPVSVVQSLYSIHPELWNTDGTPRKKDEVIPYHAPPSSKPYTPNPDDHVVPNPTAAELEAYNKQREEIAARTRARDALKKKS